MFEVDYKRERLQELEQLTLAPGFWDNQEKAQKVQQEQGAIQNIVEGWDTCQAELEETELLLELGMSEGDEDTLKEVDISLSALLERVETVELECMFTGDHDASNAMITIHAGAGGTEAQDWVSILLRMYLRWAEAKKFPTEILDMLPGDEAGVKGVTIMVTGHNAYGLLRSEMGIHRPVRISPF
ncbi:MAG TPA: PCRF domain-containing protein, partial [Deltaproteobacteria bacterium]|nr:PCRF domain-containing protein [Deltaproteobacteria bacterium]